MQDKKTELRGFCLDNGAELFGVANIEDVKAEFKLSKKITEKLNRAISIGVSLLGPILEEIEDEPTKLYFHHYRTVNMFLDQLAFRVAKFIQEKGYSALAIPASQIVDWEKQTAHLSHKKIGYLAGLGWIGRNNLLVNPKLGSQIRLVTLLTDLNLEPDKPLRQDCGDCKNCLTVCPVSAIKERPKDFAHLTCFNKLKEFQKKGIVGQFICGICVKACGAYVS